MPRTGWMPLGLLMLLGSVLVACGPAGGRGLPGPTFEPYPPQGFAHWRRSLSVELYWNCARPTPNTLRLQGVAVNPAEPEVRHLEFTVVGVDARGATVSEGAGAARKLVVGTMQSTPIEVELRTTGREVRFDLYYEYQAPSQGGGEVSEQLADAPAIRLVATRPILLAQAITRLMVRDICPEARQAP